MIKIKEKEYLTFKDALDSIDRDNREEAVIEIEGCVYGQTIIDKPNVTVRGGTFAGNLGGYEILEDGIKRGTFRSYTLFIDADNVKLEDVSVVNFNGYENGQAIALMVSGDNFKARNCRISSYQDTLFIAPLPEFEYEKGGFRGPLENRERRHVHTCFEKCLIEGSVDFIFGGGYAYFHDCEIRSRNIKKEINGYVCAPSTPENERYGFIFDECRFTAEEDMDDSVYLARPWRDYGKCLIVNSEIGSHIRPEGYHDWGKENARKHCEFKEYGNINANAVNRVEWLKELNEDDLKYIDKLKKGE